MAKCKLCGKDKGFFEGSNGLCSACYAGQIMGARRQEEQKIAEMKVLREKSKDLLLSSETHVEEVTRLGLVAAEVVVGMNFVDAVVGDVQDLTGGRRGNIESYLEESRRQALDELRVRAFVLGAEAVIAVDIDYQNFNPRAGVSMLIVSVSGTAVRFKDRKCQDG